MVISNANLGFARLGLVAKTLGFDKAQPQRKTLGLGLWVLLSWVLTAKAKAAIESWQLVIEIWDSSKKPRSEWGAGI